MDKGYYAPRDINGYLAKNLSDIPKESELVDQNEYYRLYKSKNTYYIYKIKNPHSPLMSLLSKII